MKRKIVRGLIGLSSLSALMFALRLGYGFHVVAPGAAESSGFSSSTWQGAEFDVTRKNYASTKLGGLGGNVKDQAPATAALDQKYEKIATLRAETSDFDGHERALRDAVREHGALIQFEQSAGLTGNRLLRVSIGVPPAQFDAMLAEVRKIGRVTSVQLNKVDKTNEYKSLAAQRLSLEKARSALTALKSQGGKIDELAGLERQILEVEEKIQGLGVQLGEFDAENEFVTIQCALQEHAAPRPLTLWHRVTVAFEWTLPRYVGLIAVIFAATLSTLMIVVVLEKLRWIPSAVARRLDELT
ncbi:MAG: DUF4349 domain-containing protein [Polyangiales bacterium]